MSDNDNEPVLLIDEPAASPAPTRAALRDKGVLGPEEMVIYLGRRITLSTLANWRTCRTPGSPDWIKLGDRIGYSVEAADRWLEENTHLGRPGLRRRT